MGGIWALAVKDLRILSRDKMAVFFIAVFPLVYGVFFGVINSGMMRRGSSGGMKVLIIDDDRSDISRTFIEALKKEGGIRPIDATDRAAAAESVRKAQATAYMAIPAGFGETAGILWADQKELEIGIDPGKQAESAMLEGMVMQAMGALISERFSDTADMRKQLTRTRDEIRSAKGLSMAQKLILGTVLSEADRFMESLADDEKNEKKSGANDAAPASAAASATARSGMPSMEPAKFRRVDVLAPVTGPQALIQKLRSPYELTFPSAIMWGVAGCVAGFAVSLVKERTEGTLQRLRIAPVSRSHILAGKALACFLAALGVIVMMLTVGTLFFNVRLSNPVALAFATLSTTLCFVGMMMTIAVLGRTEQAVGGAGWAIITIMAMIGGGMVPLAFLPDFFQTLSNISPIKWGILALEGGIWRGFTLAEMVKPCGILLAIGAACFLTGNAILARREA